MADAGAAGIIVFLILMVIAVVWHLSSGNAEREKKAEEDRLRREMIERVYALSPYKLDILNGTIRQGMTANMVIAAWGQPAAVDRKVLKTKTKEILKYGPGPGRSFANKVIVEDGIVVGWEQH
jgi:hypothetical protein